MYNESLQSIDGLNLPPRADYGAAFELARAKYYGKKEFIQYREKSNFAFLAYETHF